jgi:hypothetical protein
MRQVRRARVALCKRIGNDATWMLGECKDLAPHLAPRPLPRVVHVKGGHDRVEAIPGILVGADREYLNDPQALSILIATVLSDQDLEDLAHRLIGDTEVEAPLLLSLARR